MPSTIIHEDNASSYIYYEYTGYEFEDPVRVGREQYIQQAITLRTSHFKLSNPDLPVELFNEHIYKEARQSWGEYFRETVKTKVPENFIKLLGSKTKKEQQNLLRGQSLTAHQLISFIYRAWLQYGFTESEYIGRHSHAGIVEGELPKLFYIDKGSVNKIGNTPYTDGVLKNVIEQKKKTVSRFFDKGNEWHCLFITSYSLKGKETWKNGQPHFHYISDKFGIPREQVVKSLLSKNYSLGSLPHIDLVCV